MNNLTTLENNNIEILDGFNIQNGVESLDVLLLAQGKDILTRDEIQYLFLLQYNNQQRQQKLQIAIHCAGIPNIQNAKVLGLVAVAAVGFFLLPGLIGVSPLMGLLIGAAVGWKALGFSNSNQKKLSSASTKRESIVSSPGFDTAPQPPQIGGAIPLVFTNKSVNPNGGVRVTGNVINAYIKTFKNEQILYTLSSLGLGETQGIIANNLLIDNQPLDNFLQDEVFVEYTSGRRDQTRFSDFPYYSQCVSPQNNASLGISFKAVVNNDLNGNTFTVLEDDFEAFSPSDKYQVNTVDFRVVSKTRSGLRVFCDRNISALGDRRVHVINTIVYKTTKRCSRIDLNFAFDIWARDTSNNLVKSGIAFLLEVNGVVVANFYEVNAKEGTLRRSITIGNLPLQKHRIRCLPITLVNTNYNIYRLDDSGNSRIVYTGFYQGSREIIVTIESSTSNELSVSQLNTALATTKAQNASDRGANGRLTSVNEIVYPENIGQAFMVNYPGLVLAKNVIKGSNRLSASPAYSHEVSRGLLGRQHLVAGEAGIGSNGATLIVNGLDLSQLNVGNTCRNITRQTESTTISISSSMIVTQNSLSWTPGDKFLIFYLEAINYFPDFFVWSLTEKVGGLGNLVDERFINFPSICESRKFCKDNALFFDTVIDQSQPWDELINQESLASLVYPTKYAGNYGLKPETYTNPTDIFNASRINPGSFSQSKPDSKKINAVQLTYKADIDGVKEDKTITCLTADLYFGREVLESMNVNYSSITTEEQAKKVAARMLKSRILQNKVVTFSTGICGFHLGEGDLILIQYGLTEKESEISGFAKSVQTFSSGTQEITLSKYIPGVLGAGHTANIYHLESGVVETQKAVSLLPNGNLLISGLSEAIKPPREGFNADIIIICRDISEKLFRVVSIKPKEYNVEVSCINWSLDILNSSDLYFIT